MNKTELIKRVSEKTGSSRAEEKERLETILEIIGNALAEGDDVQLRGFGRFRVESIGPREYRNPRTGAMEKTAATKKVRFKGGSSLQGKVS